MPRGVVGSNRASTGIANCWGCQFENQNSGEKQNAVTSETEVSAAALTSVLDAFLPAFLSYALRTRFLAYCLFLSITSSVQSLSHVRLFVTPWIAACQAALSITNYHNGVPKEWQAPNRRSFFPPFCTEGTLHSNRFLKEMTKRSPQMKVDDMEISLHEVGLTLISLWAELWAITGHTNW